MKNTFKRIFCILLTLCMIVVPLVALSSCSKEDGQNSETTDDAGYSSFDEGFTDKKVTGEDAVIGAIESVADELGIKDPEKELKVEDSTPVGDDTYYRVQQYYNDIPVYGKTIALSADKDGNVTALTSNSIKTPEGVDTTPSASMEAIEKTVVDYFKNTVGVTDAEGNIKIGELGKDHLYIYEKDDGTAVLTYVIQVGFSEMVIDADSAELIVAYSTVNEDSTEMCFNADGSESFYGYYSKSEDTHIAYNEERGITVYNYVNQNSRLTSDYGIRLESEDVYFGNVVAGNTTEADREFGKGVTYINNLSKIYDYYNEKFSEKAYGEFTACYNDGYYDGANALGGRTADNKGYISMGSVTGVDCLDTMAHEYTHVVSRHNVNWISIDAWVSQTDEPGAINEGYSDIFGELIEAEIKGTAPDWIHGDRNMIDPMSNNYPAKVGDRPFEEFTNQNGVKCWGMPLGGGSYTDYSHGFSTIISHSAYLMWNGIDGTGSKKIDADTLAELWYRAMLLLQSDAAFSQCANAVVSIAQHMYRNDPASFTIDQLNCVKEAFENTGITIGGYAPVANGSTVFAIEKNSTASYNNYHVLVESIDFSKNTATKKAEADVKDRSGYKLDLDPGAYRITVSDNTENGSKSTFSKNIRILEQGKDSVPLRASNINIYTDFKAPTPVTDFTVPDELIITLGELGVIEPEFEPYDANGYTIKWSSSDESVATVSPTGEAGIITTLSKGNAVITAELTSNGKTITKTTNIRVASKGRDTVLVLDVSGSMYGDPLREMKESAIQFCNDLLKDEYNNRVGLVFYDNSIVTVDLTNDLDMLVSRIQAVDDGGRTNMEGGLAAADYMLQQLGSDNAIKNVVIMADGLPNLGNTSSSGSMPQGTYSGYNTSVKYASAVIDTAKGMMSRYNMYSLGFFHGLYGDEKEFAITLMKELTNMPDGYYQVDKAEELQFAFGDISDEISVSSKIVINIACPVDVTVSYGGEKLYSGTDGYNDVTSFGTMHLVGKDKDIKIVSLDSDKEYDVEITGTGEGKMDYSINYFDEKEKLFDFRSFEAVPITPSTIITTNTNNSAGDIELNVDADGDGEVDEIWTASEKSKGKITYEKIPSEPEKTEPEETEESVPAWSIALIAGVGILAVGGIVLVIVLASQKGGNKEKDIYIPVIENNDAENVPVTPVVSEHKATPAVAGRIIQVSGGSMNGFEVPIMDGETLYLGKDPKIANIVFTSDYKNVSRMHCTIMFDSKTNKYYVTDCSSNGTYLAGGERLTKGKRTAMDINTMLILANNDCVVLLR